MLSPWFRGLVGEKLEAELGRTPIAVVEAVTGALRIAERALRNEERQPTINP